MDRVIGKSQNCRVGVSQQSLNPALLWSKTQNIPERHFCPVSKNLQWDRLLYISKLIESCSTSFMLQNSPWWFFILIWHEGQLATLFSLCNLLADLFSVFSEFNKFSALSISSQAMFSKPLYFHWFTLYCLQFPSLLRWRQIGGGAKKSSKFELLDWNCACFAPWFF